jgi:putative transposase
MQYRRAFTPGGTFFFTVVTFNRQDIFTGEDTVSILRNAFRNVVQQHPIRIDAFVLLPDHLHTIWTMPEGDSNYPTRWRLIKSMFSRGWAKRPPVRSISRRKKGEQAIWQRLPRKGTGTMLGTPDPG